MKNTSDVIVVGGGVIGLLTAYVLRERGVPVTLIERAQVGAGSTRAGGGILSPVPPWDAAPAITALARESQTIYPALAASLLESTGIDVEYIQSGVLMLGESMEAAAREWSDSAGQRIESLDATALRELEPRLAQRWREALWLPGLGQLRNPRLTVALHRALLQAGVTVRENTPVTGFAVEDGRVTGVQTAAGDFSSNVVIVATGAWTGSLLGEWAVGDIQPVRGQMLWYELPRETFSRILVDGDRYLIPRRDGVCLVGSTVEYAGFENETTSEARQMLSDFAASLSPVFEKRAPSGQWSGLRPGLTGGIPIVSAHPKLKGLFINAGHFRNGINLGPASARLMCDLVLGRNTALDAAPYTAQNHLYSRR